MITMINVLEQCFTVQAGLVMLEKVAMILGLCQGYYLKDGQ